MAGKWKVDVVWMFERSHKQKTQLDLLRANFRREGLKIEYYTGSGTFKARIFRLDDPSDYFGPHSGIAWFGGAFNQCLAQMDYWLSGWKVGRAELKVREEVDTTDDM